MASVSALAIEFSRFLQTGLQELQQLRDHCVANPHEWYLKLLDRLRIQYGIEYRPITKTSLLEGIAQSTEVAVSAFFAWLYNNVLLPDDPKYALQTYRLDLLSQEGPDPALFTKIQDYVNKHAKAW